MVSVMTTTTTEKFKIIRRRAAKEDWCACEAHHDVKGRCSVSGVFVPAIDADMKLEGKWAETKWGLQFKVSRVITDLVSDEGVIAFLMCLPNLGRARAEAMLKEHSGKDGLCRVLEDGDIEALSQTSGITPARAEALIEAYAKEASGMALYELCAGKMGLSDILVKKIQRKWGVDAEAILAENPYRLEDIHSIGFKTADSAAAKMGIASDDPRCGEATAKYLLSRESKEGHVWTNLNELRTSKYAAECRASKQTIGTAISASDLFIEIGEEVALSELAEAEEYVAKRVREMNSSDGDDAPITINPVYGAFTLHEDQVRGVETALSHRVCVVTGGPGVGKTTVIQNILDKVIEMGLEVSLCAPTGKAALRMAEQCGGFETSTIHRLLKYHPDAGFRHHSGPKTFSESGQWMNGGPIDTDCVIVDEFSMVDILLFRALVSGIPKHCRVLIVGDVDQLPSIGPGQVLKDLIDAGIVPVCSLTKIFRQAEESAIPWLARDINEGRSPKMNGADDVVFVESEQQREVIDQAVALPLFDSQVIAPQYAGDLGVDALNSALQRHFQGNVEGRKGCVFIGRKARAVVGDKVINKKNQYKLSDDVYNGEVGKVISCDFSDADAAITIAFADKVVKFPRECLTDIQLAYCITGHSYQGSQAATVIVCLSKGHQFMLTRKWVYTAVTRAAEKLIMVGSESMLARAARNTRGAIRRTGLKKLLST